MADKRRMLQGGPAARAPNLHLYLSKKIHLHLHKDSLRLLLMLGRCLSKIDSQSASAGSESAHLETRGAVKQEMHCRSAEAQKLKEENAELKRKLEVMEQKAKSSLVSTIQFKNSFCFIAGD